MKKIFLILTALAMSATTWAETAVDTILFKGFAGSTSTSYVSDLLTGSSQNGITVAANNFNPSTAQIKGNQTSAAGNFFVYNTDAYPAAITKIEIIANIDANNYFKNNMYAATGTTSQAEVTDVAAGAAWNLGTASWTFDEADGVTYFKLYSNEKFTNGSVKEAKVVVTYGGEPTPQKEVVDVKVTDEPTKMEYFVGESFDPAGLTVTAMYDDASTEDVTSNATWTITPETFTEASESASVSVKAEFNKVKSKSRTITGIVVKAKEVTYANTYTSNVELSTEGVTSASTAKVVIGGTEYDAIKAGTGSTAGVCVITIPANTKTLHFHAAGWKGETVVLNETINLVADEGVTSNTPFSLKNDPETQDYFTIDPHGATTITFTATSGKRFVLFGVNAELEEGTVTAPSFTPTESEFDGSVEVTLTADDGAEIYFTVNGSTPDSNTGTYYEGPFTLNKTTTVKAIASKGGKDSEVAEKTYTKIPKFNSLDDLVSNLPATETNVTVIVTITDAVIDSLFVTSKGDISGIYVTAANTKVELYQYNVPETWVAGGKVSGTIKAQWGLFKGVAELQKWGEEGWKAFTYTAPPKPKVDETGITVNGRKYGFPVRMVTDVK